MRRNIYLAAPLFSESERMANEATCAVLEKWCDVFLPQRDGRLVGELVRGGATPREAYASVFERDVMAIRNCDALVINLDGRTIDEGAAFELGMAHALGKTCVGIRTDIRVLIEWGLNPMIVGCLSATFSSLSELEGWATEFAAKDDELRSVA